MRPWAPGENGNPEATLNTAAFCDELKVSSSMHTTSGDLLAWRGLIQQLAFEGSVSVESGH